MVAKSSGSNTKLTNSTTKNLTFAPDLAGKYTLYLVVNDSKLDSDIAEVVVTVNDLVSNSVNATTLVWNNSNWDSSNWN